MRANVEHFLDEVKDAFPACAGRLQRSAAKAERDSPLANDKKHYFKPGLQLNCKPGLFHQAENGEQ